MPYWKAISYLENQDAIKNVLLEHQIAISMNGRGSWRDNVFLERFWRSVKYLVDAVIGYNSHRPHSSLDGRTPDQANFNSRPFLPAEAPLIDAEILLRQPQPPPAAQLQRY